MLQRDLSISTERYTAEIDAATYIREFRRTEYFIKLCQQCGNYGRRYGCPPLDEATLASVGRYRRVRIIGVKITPRDTALPLEAANELMEPVIAQLNGELLAMERELGGVCFGFVGKCPYCADAPCARIEGKPCRHPEKVRPSLEAVGFDISRTAQELLGLEIKWGRDGRLPEYLTLVCGIFYERTVEV